VIVLVVVVVLGLLARKANRVRDGDPTTDTDDIAAGGNLDEDPID
jgi:hypothetical protein